jgi:predicted dehydrogenase
MKTYRAVVVGCGARAPAHIEAYQHLPNTEIVACSAPSSTRREPLAQKYGLRAYADPAEMIRAEHPDIVHLVTWPDTRVELMTLVSELGVPLCTTEKPLATAVKDWRKLVELEKTSATKFGVCHQLRWQTHLMKCQEALNSGRLGKVLLLDISAGMNIAGQGTHTLNYGMSLMGDVPVARVFANAHGWDAADPGHPGPAASEANLIFANGARGLWTSGFISPRCGDPATTWQHVRTAAYAERGRVLYEEFANWEIVGPGEEIERGNFGGMEQHGRNNLLAQSGFYRAMFDWLEGGPEAGTSLRKSLHEWAVVLAMYQSALEHRPVDLEGFDPPDDLVEKYKGQ